MHDTDEPLERLELALIHPADKTFNTLHDQALATKRELSAARGNLRNLLEQLPEKTPKAKTQEHKAYLSTLEKVQNVKKTIVQKNDELMEILKTKERISQEMQKRG